MGEINFRVESVSNLVTLYKLVNMAQLNQDLTARRRS